MVTRPDAPSARRLAGLLAAALLPAAYACGGGDGARASERATGYRGVELERPVPEPDVVLTSDRGEPYRLAEETEGSVTLLFFGYTNCPDVCPAQMANLAAVYEDLRPSVRERIQVLFVTADPARDTLSRLRRWVDGFHESFVGLRGPPATVDSLQRALGLQPGVRRPGDGGAAGRYAVAHSSAVLAFTPDDTAHLAYPFGTRQRDWAHDLPKLVEEGWDPR